MYKYVASEEEKKEINLLVNKITEELKQKYDVNSIFKSKNKEDEIVNTNQEDSTPQHTELVKIDEKKENFFSSIISFIKRFFKKQ